MVTRLDGSFDDYSDGGDNDEEDDDANDGDDNDKDDDDVNDADGDLNTGHVHDPAVPPRIGSTARLPVRTEEPGGGDDTPDDATRQTFKAKPTSVRGRAIGDNDDATSDDLDDDDDDDDDERRRRRRRLQKTRRSRSCSTSQRPHQCGVADNNCSHNSIIYEITISGVHSLLHHK